MELIAVSIPQREDNLKTARDNYEKQKYKKDRNK